MNHPKNQHYVPQFLLRNFAGMEGNIIWCYDKMYHKIEPRSISRVASSRHFYDLVPGKANYSLEQPLSEVETWAAPIISRLIEHREIQTLTQEEKYKLALFIAIQDQRTVSNLTNLSGAFEQLAEKLKDWFQEGDTRGALGDERLTWRSIIMGSADFAEELLLKNWMLLECDNALFSSDHPVNKYNPYSNPHRGTLGYRSEGIQMYLPLSPSVALAFFCEKKYRGLPLRSSLSNDNILFQNSLQVRWADRFIFSHTSDFSLVEQMHSEGEL